MRLRLLIFIILISLSCVANAIVPQRFIKIQYPLNYTIASFTKVIQSGRYQGDDLAQLYWERAVQYGDLHHYDKAIADYSSTISLKPDYESAYLNRAVAHARLEKYDQAFADFEQALSLSPNNVATINTRGTLNFMLGKYDAAIADFKRYLALRPDDIYRMLWLYISEKHKDKNKPSEIAMYAKGANLNQWPGAIVRLYIGEVPIDNVISALNNNLSAWSKGSQCEAFFYLGQYFLLQGDRAQAVTYFRNAVQTKAIGYMEYEMSIVYSQKL